MGDLRADGVGDAFPEFAARARTLGGVPLAVGSAFHPADTNVISQFADAIEAGQVAGGLIRLTT
ncbi:hypothetical protein ACIA5E_18210 [Nocardia asteroides]|uniref:hypothetical protein n=1 Tax=Nocardia asteroides TaxID=1824 RepID=UPI0037BDEE37